MVISIMTYGMKKAEERMSEANVKWTSLTDFESVIELAAEREIIDNDQIDSLKAFRDNPSDESWIKGA